MCVSVRVCVVCRGEGVGASPVRRKLAPVNFAFALGKYFCRLGMAGQSATD